MSTEGARSALLLAAIRCLLSEYDGEGPDAAADAEHAAERLAFAARDLAAAVDALPADRRPAGWSS